eukprot:7858795-Pyramimonas_sp.AAC.1
MQNWPPRPYEATLSLENAILPPILYRRHMSVSSPSARKRKRLVDASDCFTMDAKGSTVDA